MTAPPRWQRLLLRLYPKHFRETQGADLLELYCDRRLPAHVVVWDLVKNAVAVRCDELRHRRRAPARNRAPRERRMNLDGLTEDVRLALRTLRKSPTFSFMAAATLALGIGTNASMFAVANGVLFRDLPYHDPDRLVAIWGADVDGRFGVSERERERYEEQTQTFASFATYVSSWVNLTGDGEAVRVRAAAVTADVLATLGVSPILGRAFSPDEDRPGADDVAIVSYELWQTRFGARADVIGTTLLVDGRRRTIVGVLPADLRLPGDFVGRGAALHVPLAFDGEPDPRNIHYLRGVARLAEGVELSDAEQHLSALSARLVEEIETLPPAFQAVAVSLKEEILGDVRPAVLTLLAAVGFVLLIACVNVSNLFLARSDARRRDVWIRSALGAGRSRLMGPMLGESLVLAVAGGAAGLGLAAVVTRALGQIDPSYLPRVDAVDLDLGVVSFTGAITIVTGAVFGLAPAWRATRNDHVGPIAGARIAGGPRRHVLRRALVVGELALALMLVSGAGLLLKSFVRLSAVEPGFNPEHVLTMEITLPAAKYTEQTASRNVYRELLDEVRALPGVVSAGAVSHLPLASATGDWGVRIEGREEERLASGRGPWAQRIVTTDGYFETLGNRLLAGRLTQRSDDDRSQPVVVINETMARRYWPDSDAIGKRFKLTTDIDGVYRTVIGVVADTKHEGLDAEVLPEMYLPHAQFPATADFVIRTMSVVARTASDPHTVRATARDAVARLDPDVPVSRMASMEDVVAASTSAERVNVVLFGVFGVLALSLVSVGVYGVMSFSVTERSKEMGIRMALGARPRAVLLSILGEGVGLAAIGIGVGLVGALAVGRSLTGLLFGVAWYDSGTLVVIPLIILGVALAACYVPARRATRVSPVDVLRYQ